VASNSSASKTDIAAKTKAGNTSNLVINIANTFSKTASVFAFPYP